MSLSTEATQHKWMNGKTITKREGSEKRESRVETGWPNDSTDKKMKRVYTKEDTQYNSMRGIKTKGNEQETRVKRKMTRTDNDKHDRLRGKQRNNRRALFGNKTITDINDGHGWLGVNTWSTKSKIIKKTKMKHCNEKGLKHYSLVVFFILLL